MGEERRGRLGRPDRPSRAPPSPPRRRRRRGERLEQPALALAGRFDWLPVSPLAPFFFRKKDCLSFLGGRTICCMCWKALGLVGISWRAWFISSRPGVGWVGSCIHAAAFLSWGVCHFDGVSWFLRRAPSRAGRNWGFLALGRIHLLRDSGRFLQEFGWLLSSAVDSWMYADSRCSAISPSLNGSARLLRDLDDSW